MPTAKATITHSPLLAVFRIFRSRARAFGDACPLVEAFGMAICSAIVVKP